MMPTSPEDRRRRYGEAALDRACEDVATSGPGIRNDTLNREAFGLGRLAADGNLSEVEVMTRLIDSARAAGIPPEQARATIRSGWNGGLKQPRQIPAGDLDSLTRRRDGRPHPTPPAPSRQEDSPNRPPAAEVQRLWADCVDVGQHAQTAAWLTSRGISEFGIAALAVCDLARAIPQGADCPKWAGTGDGERWRSWPAAGYTLAVPLFDADGNLQAVKARLTGPQPWPDAPKALDPKGHQVKGLVMATPGAVELLRGNPPDAPVLITEGVPDWLTWAQDWPTRAVFGIESGFWTRAHADKVPDGATVAIRTHDDPAGWKYAAAIVETFKGRKVRLMQRQRGDNG